LVVFFLLFLLLVLLLVFFFLFFFFFLKIVITILILMLRFIFLYVRVFVFGLLVSFGSFVLYLCLFFVHNLTIRWMHIGFRSRGGFGNRCLLLLFLFVFFLMFAGLLSRLLRSNRLRLLGFLRLLLGLFGLGGFGAGLTRSLALLADDLVLFFFFVLGRFGLGLLLLEHPHLTIVLLLFPGGLLVVRGLLGLRQHLPLLAHSLEESEPNRTLRRREYLP